ncbi:MAG: tail fiber domain-containing protein, partial [Candidatus Paceibacterota bacterium]
GTITGNYYALNIDDVNLMGATNNYAIYAVNGKNYFGGDLEVGGVSTSSEFVVGSGLTLGGVRRTSWPVGVVSDWQVSGGLLSPTTTIGVSLPADLIVSGNATTTGVQNVGSLKINSELFSDLTGTNLELDSGRLDLIDSPTLAGNLTVNGNTALATTSVSGDFNVSNYFNVMGGKISNHTSSMSIIGGTNLSLPRINGLSVSQELVGNYLYMAFQTMVPTDVLRIVDVTDLSNPTVIGGDSLSFPIPSGSPGDSAARCIDVSGKYAYLGFEDFTPGDYKDFRIVDVSDPKNPYIVGGSNLEFSAPIRGIKVIGKYAYLAVYSPVVGEGFAILDVSDPTNPRRISPVSISGLQGHVRSVDIQGKYAYVVSYISAGTNIMRILDISDPTNPVVVGGSGISLPGYGRQIKVVGKYAYVIFDAFGTAQGIDNGLAANEVFRIVDVSDPTNPEVAGGSNLNFAHIDDSNTSGSKSMWIADQYAYVMDSVENSLRLIDTSSSTNPTFIDRLVFGISSWSVIASGHHAFVGFNPGPVGYGTDVLRIVDMGGFDSFAGDISSLHAGNLSVVNDATIFGRLKVFNGLVVDSLGIYSNGVLTVTATTSASYLAGGLGIGSSTPSTMLTVSGTSTLRDVIPEANLTYTLGDIGHQWNSLWAKDALFSGNSTTTGFSALSTTTLAFDSKIGNTTQGYLSVENYYMGTIPPNTFEPGVPAVDTPSYIPLIRFSSPNLIIDNGAGGIADTLFITQTSDDSDPSLVFGAKDFIAGAETTLNGGILNYATTTHTFFFTNVDQNPIELIVNGSTTIAGLTDNGAVYSNNGLLTNTAPSSMEYKNSIATTTLNIDALLGLQVKSFNWKNNGHQDYGLIAEDIKEVLPELYHDDGVTKGYRQDHLVFYLLQIAQRQEADLKALKAALGVDSLSIGSDGSLTFKKVTIGDLIVDQGVTIKDRATGQYTCVYVENGVIKTSIGECAIGASSNASAKSGSTDGGEEASSTLSDRETGYGTSP